MSLLQHFLVLVSVASLVVIVAMSSSSDSALGNHTFYDYQGQHVRFQNSYVIWCVYQSLSGLPSGAVYEYEDATQTLSNPSDWFLAPAQGCGSAKIWAGARSFSQYGYDPYPGICFCGPIPPTQQYITLAIVYLNTDRNWSFSVDEGSSMGSAGNQCNPSCDVETIALHEIGHSARFKHPTTSCIDTPTIMCVDYRVRRTLPQHDIAALQTLY